MLLLMYPRQLPFFLSAEETMKTRNILLVVVVVVLILLFVRLVTPKRNPSDEIMRRGRNMDLARFTPEQSVDIAQAMGLVTFSPPSMLNPPTQGPPLLLFPPTQQELERLSGSQ